MPQPSRLGSARPTQGQITNKDARRVVCAAIEAGWEWVMTGKGHSRLRSPDGVTTVIVSGSSSDGNAARVLRRELRRGGLSL